MTETTRHPRILVIAPGHSFSTYDVYCGLVEGLRAAGATVLTYPLHDTLETMELLVGAAQQLNISERYPDPMMLASAGIPGFAMAHQVEWVIAVHGLNIPPAIPYAFRQGGYKTALFCTESPYQLVEEAQAAQHYDLVLTSERKALDLFGKPTHYLPHAYRPSIHTPDGPRAEPCDVFFAGTMFPERAALIDAVDWTGIDFRDKALRYTDSAKVPDLLAQIIGNSDVASHYRSAKIAINQHRTAMHPTYGGTIRPGDAESLNPRAYEVPACGGFLISDPRAELDEVFAGSVPTYTDSDSLGRVIRYYLAHEGERRALAERQRAAVQSHTWASRANALLATLAAYHAA